MIPAPTTDNILAALRAFLLAVLPAIGSDGKPVEVLASQQNRVAEPIGTDYVVMTPGTYTRNSTNVDSYADCRFTGSIAAGVLTISVVQIGVVQPGATVQGSTIAAGTVIGSQLTGTPGGAGTYGVAPAQTVTSQTLSAGGKQVQQAMIVNIRLDFHSDNDTDSGDMATTVSTLLRDEFGVAQFAGQSPQYGVVPLYTSDPRQTPFFNDQQQVENRWVVEAILQANVVVSVPQQFADSVSLGLVEVDAAFPP